MPFPSRIHVGTSENLNHAFTRAIDNFFSAATDDSDEKRKGDLKNGFQSLLQGVLDSVLGSGSGAETLGESHFFVAEHNVIVRCDVKIWHYKLNAKSIKEDCDVAGAYLLTKNVLNTKKVPVETIIYTMSEICKDDLDSVKALLERIKEVAKIIGDFDHQEFALAANRYYASLRAPSEVTSSSRYA